MVGKTKALVLTGYGINCAVETAYAVNAAGGNAEIRHASELLNSPKMLESYNFLLLPGGFSFGDDIASGKVLANRIRHRAGKELLDFISRGKLIIGICNGFQALVKMGLLPEPDYEQRATLTYNESGKFEDRWVRLEANPKSPCIFTRGIDSISLPCRHGEGRFIPRDEDVLKALARDELIALKYSGPLDERGVVAYPWNPNGSTMGIAGICDKSGQVFGMMPHPEAYNHRTNGPCWANGVGTEGHGLALFRNAVEYLEREW